MELKFIGRDVIISDARITRKNFAGLEEVNRTTGEVYNQNHERHFDIMIENEEMAKELQEFGFKVSASNPNQDGDVRYFINKIACRFDKFPPDIYKFTGSRKYKLSENELDELDRLYFDQVDLRMNLSNKGKAYVKKLYVVVAQDDIDKKYAHYFDDNDLSIDDEMAFM